MRRFAAVLVPVAALSFARVTAQAQAVVEWVTVGDSGNVNDTEGDGYGGVDYVYSIGKCEVTNAQYAESLNAKATVGDRNGVYNTNTGGGWNDIGGISRTGSGTAADPCVYATRPNSGNRSVNYASWSKQKRTGA